MSRAWGTGPAGLLVAAWHDGRVLRARDGKDPRNGYEEGRLSALGLRGLPLAVLNSKYPEWCSEPSSFDAPDQWTSICVARKGIRHQRARYDPAKAGGAAPAPEYELMTYLMRLRLEDPKRADEPGAWADWFRPVR